MLCSPREHLSLFGLSLLASTKVLQDELKSLTLFTKVLDHDARALLYFPNLEMLVIFGETDPLSKLDIVGNLNEIDLSLRTEGSDQLFVLALAGILCQYCKVCLLLIDRSAASMENGPLLLESTGFLYKVTFKKIRWKVCKS